MTTRFHRAALICGLAALPFSASAISFGNAQGMPTMGERLSLTIPIIDPGSLQAECIGIVPLPNGSDATFFPRKTEITFKTDKAGRLNAIGLNGPAVIEPVIEFRVQTSCGVSLVRDYTLLAMPARELRYAPVVLEPAISNRPMPTGGETLGTTNGSRPGPSLEQMAGSRFPNQNGKRNAFKQQVRALNPDALHGIPDNAALPLNVDLKFPAEEPAQASALTAKQKKSAKKPVPKRKANKKPANSKPIPKPTSPPTANSAVAQPPVQTVTPPPVAEQPQDRLQISRGGSADVKQQSGSAEARLSDHAADTFAKQAELTARLEQTERAYNELKEVILRMENRMLAVEKERLRLVEESQQKFSWAIPQIVISILGGGIIGAAGMVFAQNRRRRREADAIFDIGEIRNN